VNNTFETRKDWNEALHIVWKYDLQNVASRVIDGEGYIFAQYDLSEVITPQDMARLKELGWFYDGDMGAFYQFDTGKNNV
jgi:hypothetical protein